jgi:hypothetical protein
VLKKLFSGPCQSGCAFAKIKTIEMTKFRNRFVYSAMPQKTLVI